MKSNSACFDDQALLNLWDEITDADVNKFISEFRELVNAREKTDAHTVDCNTAKPKCVCVGPAPGISDDVRSCLAKLPQLFQKIAEDNHVHLSREHQLKIARLLWLYLEPGPSPKYEQHQRLLALLARHQRVLADIGSELSQMSVDGLASEYLELMYAEEDELRNLADLVRMEMPKKRKVGHPRTTRARLSLVNGLARIYRLAGGSVSASWDDDGVSLKGGFPAFLIRIWEVLPWDAKPPTASTFARLARQVDRSLRGQGNSSSAS
jgi:hypothetical protein